MNVVLERCEPLLHFINQNLRGKNCDQRENSLLENIQKNIAIMTFKSLNDLTPVYLKQCFQNFNSISTGYPLQKISIIIIKPADLAWEIFLIPKYQFS